MPRPDKYSHGRRVNIWVSADDLKTWDDIDNHSNFVHICLKDAAGIMAWAILMEKNPEKYHTVKKLEEVKGEYNSLFPLDPLTAKRIQPPSHVNSANEPELW